jgi:tetratricopeptide (TPR) repeat protein
VRTRLASLAALALSLAAAAHARADVTATPDEIATSARVAEKQLDEWRFAEGRSGVADLVRLAPKAPETLYLEGYERFLEGDYGAAVQKLDAALGAGAREALAANARELRTLASEARDAVKDHKEERFGHFLIRYPAVDGVLVPYAREALEAAYRALHDDLGFEAELPIRIELYRSPSDLAAVSSLTVAEVARTGTIALCKWARLMVTSPRALATGYPWLDTINHELVHYAVSSLTRDRAPVWLQEGLAKFLERRWHEAPGGRIPPAMEHLLAKALRGGKLISFEAMHPSMAKLPSAEDATLAFAEVANAVAHLYAQKGAAGLRDAIKRVADGEDAREAVAAAADVTWPEFERGWKAYMAAQKYKTFPAIDIPTTHIRKAGAIASQRKPTEDEALSPSGKMAAPAKFLRLGNMLLRRDRPRAAVIEYEKGAKAAASAGHGRANDAGAAAWLFPVKLGRTYLVLGEPDRALKALEPIQPVYPDLPWPHVIAGAAKMAKGEPAAAIVELRAALATNPFDPEVHCTLADAYERAPVTDAVAAGASAADLVARERRFCKELQSGDPGDDAENAVGKR